MSSPHNPTTTPRRSFTSGEPKDSSPTRLPRIESRDSTTSTTPTLASGSSYFTFPVTYSVNGLLRRLSSDTNSPSSANPPPRRTSHPADMKNSLSKSLSSSWSWSRSSSRGPESRGPSGRSGATSMSGSAYMSAPLGRRESPFQPPPLTPLDLSGYKSSTTDSAKLLSKTLAEEIRLLVPPRLQLAEEWKLVFGLEQDGVSLATFYQKCEPYRGSREGFVLVVKDGLGGVSRTIMRRSGYRSC
jgi:hypothetical protein